MSPITHSYLSTDSTFDLIMSLINSPSCDLQVSFNNNEPNSSETICNKISDYELKLITCPSEFVESPSEFCLYWFPNEISKS